MPDPRKRPGTIKAICEFTGLDRHQVAALLKNEVKYVPLDALSKLCAYLIERGFANADELPGRLFGVEPEHFWELIARRRRLELCLGVRQGEEKETLDDAWVVASDSVLLGVLLNGATTLGGTADHRREEDKREEEKTENKETSAENESSPPEEKPPVRADRPHPEFLQQTLVWSPGQASMEKCKAMAGDVYESFNEVAGDKVLICLGSNKSNPVVEAMVAACFHTEPFLSQDAIAAANKRSCPIFLRYRDTDPQFPSCFGGVKLAKNQTANKPGIYYEKPDGGWGCCEWAANKYDAAFVIYFHRESQGRLEMVLGGFSGLATRLLARLLARRGDEFWPPMYADEGLQIGAYVVKFTLRGQPGEQRELGGAEPQADAQIIKLDREVIARRMQQVDAGHD